MFNLSTVLSSLLEIFFYWVNATSTISNQLELYTVKQIIAITLNFIKLPLLQPANQKVFWLMLSLAFLPSHLV
jgi:hypothetical protein